MPEAKAKRTVVVRSKHGLHMRPIELFVKAALEFDPDTEIEIVRGSLRVDGKSILEVLLLAAEKDMEITIEATGKDAEAAVAELAELVESNFGEPEQESEQVDQK